MFLRLLLSPTLHKYLDELVITSSCYLLIVWAFFYIYINYVCLHLNDLMNSLMLCLNW